MKSVQIKIAAIAITIILTVAIHYGWILEPIFGESHWIHAIHGRFCYIPIVIGASLFGIRGGLITATIISLSILPYIYRTELSVHDISGETVEIIFYYAIAILTGAIIERVIKEQKENEKVQLQLERAHRLSLLGQMAATMAHEIKNPLASIKGSVEILNDTSTSPEDRNEFEELIQNEIKRVDGTIKEFLTFARPKKTEIKKMDVTKAIDSAVKQIESLTLKKHIQVKTQLESNIYINGDAEKIHQVLLNLLINSIEASSEHKDITVTLMTERSESAVIIISDHGIGIEKEELERIFDPFYTTKSSGTGLGLAVVRSIIDEHNGEIKITSQKNVGTEISIYLPLNREIVG